MIAYSKGQIVEVTEYSYHFKTNSIGERLRKKTFDHLFQGRVILSRGNITLVAWKNDTWRRTIVMSFDSLTGELCENQRAKHGGLRIDRLGRNFAKSSEGYSPETLPPKSFRPKKVESGQFFQFSCYSGGAADSSTCYSDLDCGYRVKRIASDGRLTLENQHGVVFSPPVFLTLGYMTAYYMSEGYPRLVAPEAVSKSKGRRARAPSRPKNALFGEIMCYHIHTDSPDPWQWRSYKKSQVLRTVPGKARRQTIDWYDKILKDEKSQFITENQFGGKSAIPKNRLGYGETVSKYRVGNSMQRWDEMVERTTIEVYVPNWLEKD